MYYVSERLKNGKIYYTARRVELSRTKTRWRAVIGIIDDARGKKPRGQAT